MLKTSYPRAKKISSKSSRFGILREDHYHWMQLESESADIATLIQEENQYSDAFLSQDPSLQEQIFEELCSRVKEEDHEVPEKIGNYFYYSKNSAQKEYPLHCRKLNTLEAPEEIYFDENQWAEGREYFELGSLQISYDHQLALAAVDNSGDEIYEIFLIDLQKNTSISLELKTSSADVEWVNDSMSFYFLRNDENSRPNQCYRFWLKSKKEELVHTEDRAEQFLSLDSSKDEQYIFIESHGNTSSEIHYLSANAFKLETPKMLSALEKSCEYYVEHREGEFYILSNWKNKNFSLFKCSPSLCTKDHWELVLDGSDSSMLVDFELFQDFFVLYQRESAQDSIHIYQYSNLQEQKITMPEDCYELISAANSNFKTDEFHYEYSSLTQSYQHYSFHIPTGSSHLVKEFQVPNYKASLYRCERLWLEKEPGLKIPVSLLYHLNFPPDKARALYLHGYGAYGHNLSCGFNRNLVSLLDRGILIALAHVRGGSELGSHWYEEGKLLNKKNSFSDCNFVAEKLSENFPQLKGSIALSGGSAGGLLVGAAINERPDLYKSAVMNVPFLDCLNTMLDDSQALTPLEYDEWGNPNDETYFRYIHSYSPYDQIHNCNYPACFLLAGLNDSRVKFWEALKWAHKARDVIKNPQDIFVHINIEAGHAGSSGRFEGLKEVAMEFSFILLSLIPDKIHKKS